MALHRESFYHMNFSQQESGQSTLCEHLIGLTAGEKGENAGGTGGGARKGGNKGGNKDRRKVWVTEDSDRWYISCSTGDKPTVMITKRIQNKITQPVSGSFWKSVCCAALGLCLLLTNKWSSEQSTSSWWDQCFFFIWRHLLIHCFVWRLALRGQVGHCK